jgi:AcrR family transcriptional regulator
MPRRAKLRPDEPGRERVLEAGLDLFGRHGYHATSIAQIGDQAGMTKSVLYHHFGSKAGLYEAILESETDALVSRVREAVPSDPEAPRLRPAIDAYLAFLAERPDSWRLLLRDPPADPDLAPIHERLDDRRAEMLAALLASRAKRSGQRVQVDLVAIAVRTFATWWYDHQEVPRERVVDAIAEVARAGSGALAPAA